MWWLLRDHDWQTNSRVATTTRGIDDEIGLVPDANELCILAESCATSRVWKGKSEDCLMEVSLRGWDIDVLPDQIAGSMTMVTAGTEAVMLHDSHHRPAVLLLHSAVVCGICLECEVIACSVSVFVQLRP